MITSSVQTNVVHVYVHVPTKLFEKFENNFPINHLYFHTYIDNNNTQIVNHAYSL